MKGIEREKKERGGEEWRREREKSEGGGEENECRSEKG